MTSYSWVIRVSLRTQLGEGVPAIYADWMRPIWPQTLIAANQR